MNDLLLLVSLLAAALLGWFSRARFERRRKRLGSIDPLVFDRLRARVTRGAQLDVKGEIIDERVMRVVD